jgi:ribulose-bisphosphate carboxylase small chain
MRVTQGCFSYLPDLTDEQISKQIQYCLNNGWAVSLEYTDDPHPRNTYWEMWGQPMFDISDAKAIMGDLAACRQAHGDCYIRLSAFDSTHTWESLRISFLVQRPQHEPGFMLARHEADGRRIRYETRAYVMEKPEGSRYGNGEA